MNGLSCGLYECSRKGLPGGPLEGTSPSKSPGVIAGEDANVLPFGTFGTDEKESFLRVDEVLTFNKLMPTLGRF